MLKRKNNRGQTALEYALVAGVIAVGIITMARIMFIEGGKESGAGKLFGKVISEASKTVGSDNTNGP